MPIGFTIRNLRDKVVVGMAYHAFCFCCWLGCALLWIAKKISKRHEVR